MSSGSYVQQRVKCCYYCTDDETRREIVCQGLTDDGRLVLRYRRKKDYEIQMETFCCQHWERCEVKRMLDSIYAHD